MIARSASTRLDVIHLYLCCVLPVIAIHYCSSLDSVTLTELWKILLSTATVAGTLALLVSLLRNYPLAILALIAWLAALPLAPWSRYLMLLTGIVGSLFLLRKIPRLPLAETLVTSIILFLAGSSLYINFNYHDLLSAGDIHIDTAFHAAIAAMYKHYGIASVGLDGLVPVSYHVLSHQIMAGLSRLSGLEILATYAYLYTALAPALLAFAMAATARCLNPAISLNRLLLAIATVLLALVSLKPFSMAALWGSFFTSESYLVALALLCMAITQLQALDDRAGALAGMNGIILGAAVLAAGLAKGSVGLVGVCLLGFLGVVRFRQRHYWLMVLATGALFHHFVYQTASQAASLASFQPLDFIDAYVYPRDNSHSAGKVLFFLALHYLPVWLCFAGGFMKNGWSYTRSLEFQILLGLLLPSAVAGLSFRISGGSAYYFTSIPSLLALPFLCSRLSAFTLRMPSALFVAIPLLIISIASKTNPAFIRNTFQLLDYQGDHGWADTIGKLEAIRTSHPVNTRVEISNKNAMARIIGCKAYWLYPAITERPMKNDLPGIAKCEHLSRNYGLPDYHEPYQPVQGFGVLTVELPVLTSGIP